MQVKSIAEHSAILSAFIKIPFFIKTFLSILSGRLRQVLRARLFACVDVYVPVDNFSVMSGTFSVFLVGLAPSRG